MYIPKPTLFDDQAAIIDFIRTFHFATVVLPSLEAVHVPLTYEQAAQDQHAHLYGHVAKANPLSKDGNMQSVLAIFHGPHSYISPTWYAASPAVPTWNYSTVHCYGTLSLLDERQTSEHLDQLVSLYEPELLNNKTLMPNNYRDKLTKAIVGFRIDIERIEAKEKLGQHRSQADQLGVKAGLENSDNLEAQALLRYMQNRGIGLG